MATFVPYALPGGKVKRVPMAEITKLMNLLHLTKDEAIKVWLEDEGLLINEEQEALERKAEENRITATIHQAKAEKPYKEKTQRERVKKPDEVKERIIAQCAQLLTNSGIENVEIVNESKLITFTIGNDHYKLDLIKARPKKENKDG